MGNFAVLAFPKFVHGQSVRRHSKKQRNERNACFNPKLGFDFQINENDTLIIDKSNLCMNSNLSTSYGWFFISEILMNYKVGGGGVKAGAKNGLQPNQHKPSLV